MNATISTKAKISPQKIFVLGIALKQESDLPAIYRFILKFPKLSLENFPSWFQGIFWIVIMPIIVIFDGLLNLLFLTCFNFPFNLTLFSCFNFLITVLALRILIERTINTEKIYIENGFVWDLENSLKSYIEILKKVQLNEKSKEKDY